MLPTLMLLSTMAAAPSGAVDPQAEQLLNALILKHAAEDPRLDVIAWEGEPPRATCFTDPACLTELADATGSRLLLFGEVGKKDGLHLFSIDIYDVRTGRFAGRETAQTDTSQALSEKVELMMRALVDRAFAPLGGIPRLSITILNLLPPSRSRTGPQALQVPWLLFGSGVVATAGVLFFVGAVVLYGMAFERDFQAAAATYQDEAYEYVQTRNLFALSGVMTGMVAMGLFLFASMGATYWVLGE